MVSKQYNVSEILIETQWIIKSNSFVPMSKITQQINNDL